MPIVKENQMENFEILVLYAAIAAFSFFVAAPIVLNAVSAFGVQKKFAQDMIALNIIDEKAVKEIEPKKQIAGLIISLVVLAALFFVSFRVNLGFISMGVGLLFGLLRFRHIVQFNNLTVKRFQNNYAGKYDKEKLKAYINKTF